MKKTLSLISVLLLLSVSTTYAGPQIIQGGNAPPPATSSVPGIVELATDAETVTGTATDIATTPANITAKMAAPGAIGGTTPAAGTFTTTTVGSTSAGNNLTVNATLSSEMSPALEAANWTGTDGWSAGAAQLAKVGGAGTGTATPSGAFSVVAGTTYRVTIVCSAVSGTITYTIGGVRGTQISAATITDYITASTTGKIIFSGGATDTATITSLSVIALTDGTGDATVYGNIKTAGPIQNIAGQDIVDIGVDGTFVGYQAGQSTTGIQNTFIGTRAGYTNTTSQRNTGVGYNSLYANTTGYANVGVGNEALRKNTDGYANTGVGHYALYSTTTGHTNTAVGNHAMNSITIGTNNTAVGNYSTYTAESIDHSTAIGHQSLYTTTGSNNTATGFQSLYNDGTGHANTASGYRSGYNITTGTYNVFLGFSAGENASQKVDAVGSIAIGAQSYTTASYQAALGSSNITQTLLFGTVESIAKQITAGSGTGITLGSAGYLNRQVYQVIVTYAAYADTDTTKGIVIATLPAKTKIVGFYADTTTKYTGGAVSAATLEVGITAEGAAEILAAHDVFTAAVTKGLADADMGTSMTRAAQIQGGYLPSWTGTTAIYATIDTTTGNTNALTQGSTTFYIETERY